MYDSNSFRVEEIEYDGECIPFKQAFVLMGGAQKLDLDELNVENAYFRSFDLIVRRQLDPVWHKVGPKTKQLVNDLSILRQLLK